MAAFGGHLGGLLRCSQGLQCFDSLSSLKIAALETHLQCEPSQGLKGDF